ncbi:hypothetical protein QE152_g24370 [Popillia japonica]|uniref:Uncharacterized protein n=1 Tax=Popillia japonica TaxID=7064 RepID=A0AAW1KCG5_POPJA
MLGEEEENKKMIWAIIKAQGRSYAELLKTVKTNVDLDKIGVKINKLRKTQHGDLLLEVPGKENATKLTNAVKIANSEAEAVIKSSKVVIHITNIDADITGKDLVGNLKNQKEGLQDEDIKILSLRPMLSGSQAATLLVGKEMGDNLDKIGKLKIGWTSCVVKKTRACSEML